VYIVVTGAAGFVGANLVRALLRYPLMPQRVTALIHLQAARLWLKRVPFFHKPPYVPGEGSVKR